MRFIAINNGIDSANQQDSDFTPFFNIINEWYAKDTSKKIRAVMKSKGEAGEHLCTNPPYGYMKDADNKKHWIVDVEAAEGVKRIFALCLEGYGPTQGVLAHLRLVISCVANHEEQFRQAMGAKQKAEAKKELAAKRRQNTSRRHAE